MIGDDWSTFLRRSRRDTRACRRRRSHRGGLVNLPQKVTSRHDPEARRRRRWYPLVNLPQKVTSRHEYSLLRGGQGISPWSTFLRRSRRDTCTCWATVIRPLAWSTFLRRSRRDTARVKQGSVPGSAGQPSSEGHVATQQPGHRPQPQSRRLVNLPQKVTSRHVIVPRPKRFSRYDWSTFLRRSRRDTPVTIDDSRVILNWSTFLRRSRRDTLTVPRADDRYPSLVNLPQKVTSRHEWPKGGTFTPANWSTFLRRSRRDTSRA